MVEVECIMCSHKLRKDIANIDAKWESYKIKGKYKYLCTECAKMIAQSVLDEY